MHQTTTLTATLSSSRGVQEQQAGTSHLQSSVHFGFHLPDVPTAVNDGSITVHVSGL